MAGSVNKVILVGNLGADPEIRSTQDGREIAKLRIATSESWKDRASGERRERTEWHNVVIFSDALVNVVKNYTHKGSKLYIEGALQTRKWTDQQGQERYTTEVVLQGFNATLTLLDSKGSGGGAGAGYNDNYSGQSAPSGGGYAPSYPGNNAPAMAGAGGELDDEVPF
jgi:single-strand DNA-binding protein